MRFLNSIICYNNSAEVIRYINGLLSIKEDGLSFSIVINSANASDREALCALSSKHPDGKICIYDPERNLGYLNGLMYGYRMYVKQHLNPDYVIFSNTDIEIQDKDFFEKIESRKYDSRIGCIGPSVFSKYRKVYDNPVCIERRSLSEINKLVFVLSIPILRGLYVNLSDFKGRFTRGKKENSKYVYEVHGCFFILSDSFLYKCLFQKEYGALMYSEEAYIAENIRKNGFKTFYDSDLEVIHLEHSVTKGFSGEKIAKQIRSSMMMIREEFYHHV